MKEEYQIIKNLGQETPLNNAKVIVPVTISLLILLYYLVNTVVNAIKSQEIGIAALFSIIALVAVYIIYKILPALKPVDRYITNKGILVRNKLVCKWNEIKKFEIDEQKISFFHKKRMIKEDYKFTFSYKGDKKEIEEILSKYIKA